jgi:hypothetical protein
MAWAIRHSVGDFTSILFAFRSAEQGRPSLAAWSGLASARALVARASTGLFPPLVAAYLFGAVMRRFGLHRG